MNVLAGIIILALLLLPKVSSAAELGIDATTMFRFEERSAPQVQGQKATPATQFLTVDMGKIADGNLSFHLSGWGRIDLADRSANEESTDGDLTYGYLLYRLPKANGRLRAGRFFVYDAGQVEQIDGIGARIDLRKGFDVTGFAGKPVRLGHFEDNRGNAIFGGRLGYRYGGKIDVGVSAVHEDGAWTREYNPSTGILSTTQKYRRVVNGDVWFAPADFVEINGRTSFDTVVGDVAEQTYLLTLRPIKGLSVAGEYNEQNLQSYFSAANLPITMFRPIAGTSVTSYGATATYAITRPLELTADYRTTSYRNAGYGNSSRYGFSARMLLLEKVRLGLGWHRFDSEVSGINSYDEFHGYGLYNGTTFFAAIDLLAYKYSDSIYGKDLAFQATLSGGYRVTPEVALAGDVSYGWTPLMTSETRGVFKMNYNYETKGAR